MSIEEDISTTFTNDATLNGLVSGRNYKGDIQQNPTLPYTFAQRITTSPVNNLSDSSLRINARYQIDCFAATFEDSWILARAVKGAMAAATLFESVYLNGTDGNFDDDVEGYRVILDFSVWFIE